ncbi:hypothetical protein PRIPAC_90719 [Pristionchus pacificus]|uniref:Uncharacterized protein n=1 Tax=Pristionchus pacificus TaxID=54126 RepID=A0A454Y4V9_PRIPA|nr:hypothetical protein PRIPAC_90719 [Pristionchus pacificus]|eukprot:PDM83083.1 hypothetical protein PRIPAC_37476 [Pristionchus pacificus]
MVIAAQPIYGYGCDPGYGMGMGYGYGGPCVTPVVATSGYYGGYNPYGYGGGYGYVTTAARVEDAAAAAADTTSDLDDL